MSDAGHTGDSPDSVEIPEEAQASIEERYIDELDEKEPSEEERQQLIREHDGHLVRSTTSQYTQKEEVNGVLEVSKIADVPDLYCFTCEGWVGLSGVDLTGTPRSRKDAYYLGGKPEAVDEAQQTVTNTLADLVTHVAANVPGVEDAEDALDFIETEQEKARERLQEAADDE